MQMELESLDARANPRYLTRIAIFYGPYQKKILTDYSINLSTGGVFIESNMILPEGTELTVKFNLPISDTIITTNARVAWTNDPLLLKKASTSRNGITVPRPFHGRPAHHTNVLRYRR